MSLGIRYTALLSKENLDKIGSVSELYKVIYSKPAKANANYSIIEYELISDEVGADNLEVMLETLGALVVHEDGTNAVCLIADDIQELKTIYNWEKAGCSLCADMLTAEDIKILLQKKSKLDNNAEAIFVTPYFKGAPADKVPLSSADKVIFENGVNCISYGQQGTEDIVWLPYLVNALGGYYLVVMDTSDDEDYIDEDDEDINDYWARYYAEAYGDDFEQALLPRAL